MLIENVTAQMHTQTDIARFPFRPTSRSAQKKYIDKLFFCQYTLLNFNCIFISLGLFKNCAFELGLNPLKGIVRGLVVPSQNPCDLAVGHTGKMQIQHLLLKIA